MTGAREWGTLSVLVKVSLALKTAISKATRGANGLFHLILKVIVHH